MNEKLSGKHVWNDINDSLREERWKLRSFFEESYTLFWQAVTSFDAGVNEGASLLCRATLESAFYVFLIRRFDDQGFFRYDIPSKRDGRVSKVWFSKLATEIKSKVSFSAEQSKAIDRIHTHGNLAAHLANRRAILHPQISQEVQRVNLPMSKKRYEAVAEKFKVLWVNSDQALEDLQDTSSILLTLVKAIPVGKLGGPKGC